jgi:uncharacterized SAM-binding protein YcdF (DUF218 family)
VFRRKPRRRFVKTRILLSLALLLALVWAGGFLWFVGELPREAPPSVRKTDGVVVLTGGTQRIEAGIGVLAAGAARRMLISGVNPASGNALVAQAAPEARHWYECCIDLGFAAVDTTGNAIEIAEWARHHHLRSLRVVTASFHMPRSLLEIGRLTPGIDLVSHPVFPPLVRLDDWWFSPGTADLLAREYTKLLLSWARIAVEARVGAALDRWLGEDAARP